ncbi:MAG: AAA family ATPase [Acidobacteria bacterium]|nr:AAA family ATPase [Acidobacteriota bacterium]
MNCPSCGHVNPDDARFCSVCGHHLAGTCANCSAPLPQDARFCPNCGTPVAVASPIASERKLVTVLFADVADSTALAERLDPEDLHQVMKTYFEAMRTEIEAEGGTVEKFIGDAVMAAFGVPTAHEDDSSRALRAALHMMARLDDVNDALADQHDVLLAIRIGVNSGEALTSTDPLLGEPMVTGDVVNAASRLQTAAQPGQILVAERTARSVRGFVFGDVGKVGLRGKNQPVRAVALKTERPFEARRGVPGLRAPMVGRDYEMTLLRARYRRVAAERRPDLMTIYGEPGVGKSRLAREFVDWVEDLDQCPIVLMGRCLPYGDGVTYWPLAEILRDVARIKDDDNSEEALRKIWELCNGLLTEDLTSEPEVLTAALAYTVGLEDPKYRVVDHDPREVKATIEAAWRAFLTAMTRDDPVVVVVEDIHWADTALLDLLEYLTERVQGGIIFLCTARPILTEHRPGWGGGQRNVSSISLEPLSRDDANNLVEALLRVDDLPEAIHRQILHRAGGNPFFLEEIIRNLIDNELIVRVDGGWHASEGLEEVEIPDTVQATLAARIDLLDPTEKQILQKAAVVGRIVWPGAVERLMNGDAGMVRATFDKLEERELLRSQLGSTVAGEREYIFKHVLTREVAYDSVPRSERGSAHAGVAAWLEETAGARPGEFLELWVYHNIRAYEVSLEAGATDSAQLEELRVKAFKATLQAAISAKRRYAVKRALKLAEQALSLARTPEERSKALRQKGRIAISDLDGDAAWYALKESADITLEHQPDDPRETARACAFVVEIPTRWPGIMSIRVPPEEMRHYIESGLAVLAPDDDGPERIRLLTARAMLPWGERDTPGGLDADIVTASRQAGQSAVDMAMKLERFDLASAGLDALSSVDVLTGSYGRSIQSVEQRLKIAELIRNPAEISDIYATAAWTHAFTLGYKEADDFATEGMNRTRAQGFRDHLHVLTWAAYANFFLGRWSHVTDEITPSVEEILGDRIDHPPGFSKIYFGIQALISSIRGDSSAALDRSRIERSVDADSVSGSPSSIGFVAWIVSREGAWQRALEMLAAKRQMMVFKPLLDIVTATVMFDHRQFEAAEEFLEQARNFATDANILVAFPHYDRLQGAMADKQGDLDTALSLLQKARSGFEKTKVPWEVARTNLALARVHKTSGDVDDARHLAAGALTVFADLRSLREISQADRFLTDITE